MREFCEQKVCGQKTLELPYIVDTCVDEYLKNIYHGVGALRYVGKTTQCNGRHAGVPFFLDGGSTSQTNAVCGESTNLLKYFTSSDCIVDTSKWTIEQRVSSSATCTTTTEMDVDTNSGDKSAIVSLGQWKKLITGVPMTKKEFSRWFFIPRFSELSSVIADVLGDCLRNGVNVTIYDRHLINASKVTFSTVSHVLKKCVYYVVTEEMLSYRDKDRKSGHGSLNAPCTKFSCDNRYTTICEIETNQNRTGCVDKMQTDHMVLDCDDRLLIDIQIACPDPSLAGTFSMFHCSKTKSETVRVSRGSTERDVLMKTFRDNVATRLCIRSDNDM